MKKLARTFALIFISAILSFGVVELVLRQIYQSPQPQFLIVDPLVGHRHRPNIEGYSTREGLGYVQINRHGFRDNDYKMEKSDKKRVVVLGDSFTEAFQVDLEETYHGLLETEAKKKVEVLNFGVSGYGTGQELLTYRHFARKFSPDIVVLAFNPGNDLLDNDKKLSDDYPRPYFSLSLNGLTLDNSFRISPKHVRSKFVYTIYYFLTDHSLFFSLLDQLRYRKDVNDERQHRNKALAKSKSKSKSKVDSNLLYAPTTIEHLDAWALTEYLIVELADEVKKDGAEFVLFVQESMPSQLATTQNVFYVEERLGRLCQKHAYICGFMAPEALTFHRSTGKFLHGFGGRREGHWNQDGHRVAYTVLRETLVDNGLIP